jgi:hypothetical protein
MLKITAKFLSVLALVALLSGCNMGEIMIHENQSPYDFDKTVEVITANAKAEGWMMPKVYDFQKSLLENKQPDPGKVKALKICSSMNMGLMSKMFSGVVGDTLAEVARVDSKILSFLEK